MLGKGGKNQLAKATEEFSHMMDKIYLLSKKKKKRNSDQNKSC